MRARGRGRAAGREGCDALWPPVWMVESDVFVVAFVGAASAASFSSLPCEGRGGLGRGVFEISSKRGHPLPASPCLRRGRGKSGSSRLQAIRSEELRVGKEVDTAGKC